MKKNKKLKIKVGDEVKVIAGKDKGKTGKVLNILKDSLKIKVQNIAIKKMNLKSNPNKKGEIIYKEGFIDYSNVKKI